MVSFIKKFLPQSFVNNFYHLPKAILANLLYFFPTSNLKVIGVTGTDGKTTTVNMIYKILKDAGFKVSMVSTVNAEIGGKVIDTGFHVTSPDPFTVQRFARDSIEKGDKYLILEVSSHALDQYRFWGIKFDVGVVTNITHDHLDYHGIWENYFLAKAKLIKNVKVAVVNKDEKHFNRLSKKTTGKVVSFGASKDADFNLKNFPISLKVLGEYNLLNAEASSAAAYYLGVSKEEIKKSLANYSLPIGRMEEIKNNKGFKVIVDFAATANSLEQALKSLKKITKGRLISVFGSAGLRDTEKRFLMGEVSGKYADITIITAEDPRGLLDEINKQIETGVLKSGGILDKTYYIIPDREEAINFAIKKLAKKDDTVGLFGKGHEGSMNYDGKNEILWSEINVAKKALNGR